MLINTFNDGSREKALRFTSNGSRSVVIDVPKDAMIKNAALEIETQELPDSTIIRIGLVKNCSLEEFNMLEERLESTHWGKNTVKPGWGATERTAFLVGETGRYRVIAIDPSTMIGAHPSFYRREFDVVIIPNGPFHADIDNLIGSRVPILTMNPKVARMLGLCVDESLHAAITKIHLYDRMHYVCEQFKEDDLRIGGRRGDPSEHILVDAIEPLVETSKAIIDTGVRTQSILVTSMDHKYGFWGIARADQLLEEAVLFTVFRRMIEWCSIGGYVTNVSVDICGLPGGFKKLGRLTKIVDTPDFSEKINEFINSDHPNEEGNYPVEISFHSDSPGILIAGNVRIECVFLTKITKFSGGVREVTMEFDSIEQLRTAYVEMPSDSHVKTATLKVKGDLSRERIALISAYDEDVHGVTASTRYLVAQQIISDKVLTVSRIGLHISKPEGDVEMQVEIRPDHLDVPLDDIIARSTLKGEDIKRRYSWVDVTFDNLVLKPDTKYWILLNVIKGKANWHADIKCPMGGVLRYTKDGGKNWLDHDMDALFKVYYLVESYDASPALSLLPGGRRIWGHTGDFQEVASVSDLTESINDHLKALTGEIRRADVVKVPLTFHASSIGNLKLFDLEIRCETPSLEVYERMETVTIGMQLGSILELLARVNKKVAALMEVLPEDVLDNLEM